MVGARDDDNDIRRIEERVPGLVFCLVALEFPWWILGSCKLEDAKRFFWGALGILDIPMGT